MSESGILHCQQLGMTYTEGPNHVQVLSDINLHIEEGERIAIVGASGSGKSTLLGLLAGLDATNEGEIYLDSEPLHDLDEEQRAALRAKSIGFVFQSFMLVQSLTAIENVMLPAELAGHKDAKQQAMDLLTKVGLAHRLDHYPSQLSGGEQQRVAIARAFVGSPKILFADEPSANLDTKNGQLIESLLFELNQEQGTTLLLVTHDEHLAERCNRILHIDGGNLINDSNGARAHAG